jgi:hypothetical protein
MSYALLFNVNEASVENFADNNVFPISVYIGSVENFADNNVFSIPLLAQRDFFS